ncbi:MAG: hypothetical protein C4321_02230, partial [Chloroflexota bacterium]
MARVFNYERAATILAEAAFSSDETLLKKYKITSSTLGRYRARLSTDPKMREFVAIKKAVLEREWASELVPAIQAAIDFLRRAASSV